MVADLWEGNGERFLQKIDRGTPDECWPWRAAVHPSRGSGQFILRVDGKKRVVLAHVAAWLIWVGIPPTSKRERIGTRCGNALCCNYNHLFIEKVKGTGVKRGSPLTYSQKIEAKFWRHVAPSDDLQCLLYSPVRPSGIGMVYYYEDGKRTGTPAHRYAMSLKHDPIPRDVMVLQRCGNKACVSYQHIYLAEPGYYLEGRIPKHEPCGPRGETRVQAKLTADDIPRIFYWSRVKGYSLAEIARHVGVKPSTVKNVLKRQSWRHVPIDA